jgi:hypothetical protein
MGDPWQDEGFGGAEDDWDEGKETIGADLEDELGEEVEEVGEVDDDGWGDDGDE